MTIPVYIERTSNSIKRLPSLPPRLAGRRASLKIGVVATLAIAVAANVAVLGNLGVMFGQVVPGASHQNLLEAYMRPMQKTAFSPSRWGVYRPTYDNLDGLLEGQADSALYKTMGGTLANSNGGDQTRFVYLHVTPTIAQVLGVHPIAGRNFNASDAQKGAAPVIMIAERVAHTRFGSAKAAIGKQLTLNGKTYRVAGVLSNELVFPSAQPAAGWVLFPPEPAGTKGNIEFGQHALVRPYPGTSREAIRTALGRAYRQALPDYNNGMRTFIGQMQLAPRVDTLAQREYGPVEAQLQMLELTALLLLLLVFANLAGLATSDALARRHELATRAALGAGVFQLFVERAREIIILGLIAWVAGIGLGWLGSNALALVIGRAGPSVALSVPVLMLTLAAVLIITMLLAATGIRRLRAPNALCSDLMSGGHATGGRGLARTLRTLIVLQLAISVVLLTAAGHIHVNVFGLTHGDLGFDPAQRTFLLINLPGSEGNQTQSQYDDHMARAKVFDRNLLDRLNISPGIKNAALLSIMPFSNGVFTINASTSPSGKEHGGLINIETVSKKIVPALGLHVLAGDPDNIFSGEGNTVFVDEAAVEHFWPGIHSSDVVGKTLYTGKTPLRIAAVVEPLRMKPYGSVGGTLFAQPAYSLNGGPQTFVVRSPLKPKLLRAEINTSIRKVNPKAKLVAFRPARNLIGHAYATRNQLAHLFGALSLIAVLIAAVGLFALLAYRTLVRRAEFAIRSAIGATQKRLRMIVIKEALLLWLGGTVIGIPAAYTLGDLLAASRPELGLPAAATSVSVAVVMLTITACSAFIPARRAVRTNPVANLRT